MYVNLDQKALRKDLRGNQGQEAPKESLLWEAQEESLLPQALRENVHQKD